MDKTAAPKLKRQRTPAGFCRLIAEEIALIKSRPTTAIEAQDQLGVYYRISNIFNRLQSDRATHGHRQFGQCAVGIGQQAVLLNEIWFFAQRHSAAVSAHSVWRRDSWLSWGASGRPRPPSTPRRSCWTEAAVGGTTVP